MNIFYNDEGKILGISKNPNEFDSHTLEHEYAKDFLMGMKSPDMYLVIGNTVVEKDYYLSRKSFNESLKSALKHVEHPAIFIEASMSEIVRLYSNKRDYTTYKLNFIMDTIFPFEQNANLLMQETYKQRPQETESLFRIYQLWVTKNFPKTISDNSIHFEDMLVFHKFHDGTINLMVTKKAMDGNSFDEAMLPDYHHIKIISNDIVEIIDPDILYYELGYTTLSSNRFLEIMKKDDILYIDKKPFLVRDKNYNWGFYESLS